MPSPQFNSTLPSQFPAPPQTKLNNFAFPNDLVQNNRNFYMQIQFVEYSFGYAYSDAVFTPVGGVVLPIPAQLNDQTVMTWEAVSLTEKAASMAQSAGGTLGAIVGGIAGAIKRSPALAFFGSQLGSQIGNFVGGAVGGITSGVNNTGPLTGYAVNPFLFMMFKSPNFKEFTFTWRLAPNTEQESKTLANIISYFKFHMLPTKAGPLLKYPSLAICRLFPDDTFTFRMRPCAVLAVNVNFTGGGQPSFFKVNGAPTVVELTVQLKEISLWDKSSY